MGGQRNVLIEDLRPGNVYVDSITSQKICWFILGVNNRVVWYFETSERFGTKFRACPYRNKSTIFLDHVEEL